MLLVTGDCQASLPNADVNALADHLEWFVSKIELYKAR